MVKKEKKSIKFFMDDSVNKSKKDKIIRFLEECQIVQNKMYEHLWNNFNIVINCKDKKDINRIGFKVTEPRIKSHHHQQILQATFSNLKGIETKIKKTIRFNFEDRKKQAIYNYMSKFAFDWIGMEKYIKKQLTNFKKYDIAYFEFLESIISIINDNNLYSHMKKEIERRFWEVKNKFKLPKKKELQILCNTAHTVKEIKMKEFQWVFSIDNNDIVGGTDKKPVFDKMTIPVKFSDYHKKAIGGKELLNTFTLRLNKYGRIEIIGVYEEEISHPEAKPKEFLGIDIGLKKLIATSDGEFVSQNMKLVNLAKRVHKKDNNRTKLMLHLRKKYNDDAYQLPNKNYSKLNNRLTQFVTCDNRYRVKNFLKDRSDYHIIMEDLMIAYNKTFNKDVNYLLRRLHIQQLVNDIEKYCKLFGISLSKVNPAYTSQMCNVCGHTSKSNRQTQEKFSCQICTNECNADYNAAVNIMNRLFDKRIKLDTPNWRVKEILGVID